jgi:ribosomal protein L11 methyltransferase
LSAVDRVLEIRFPHDAALEEEVEGILFLHGADGTIIAGDGEAQLLRAFFAEESSRQAAAERLGAISAITLRSLDEERHDWLESYQQSLRAIDVESRFIVSPLAELISPESTAIPLLIPQERAFGTGSHETTWLCLSMLDRDFIVGKRCVDIGTGSGILAIACEKLGARRVFAFDNDLDTFGVLQENLQRNNVAHGKVLEFFGSPESLRPRCFDMATMNIIPEVIIPLLPGVRRALVDGARILLSGILLERRDDVVAAATAHSLHLRREASRGEWWCGEFLAI